jgi:hypothetical protein
VICDSGSWKSSLSDDFEILIPNSSNILNESAAHAVIPHVESCCKRRFPNTIVFLGCYIAFAWAFFSWIRRTKAEANFGEVVI